MDIYTQSFWTKDAALAALKEAGLQGEAHFDIWGRAGTPRWFLEITN